VIRLVEAVINLLSGLEHGRAFWEVDLDPGRFRWLLDRHGQQLVARRSMAPSKLVGADYLRVNATVCSGAELVP
jgi:hypothetical protein